LKNKQNELSEISIKQQDAIKQGQNFHKLKEEIVAKIKDLNNEGEKLRHELRDEDDKFLIKIKDLENQYNQKKQKLAQDAENRAKSIKTPQISEAPRKQSDHLPKNPENFEKQAPVPIVQKSEYIPEKLQPDLKKPEIQHFEPPKMPENKQPISEIEWDQDLILDDKSMPESHATAPIQKQNDKIIGKSTNQPKFETMNWENKPENNHVEENKKSIVNKPIPDIDWGEDLILDEPNKSPPKPIISQPKTVVQPIVQPKTIVQPKIIEQAKVAPQPIIPPKKEMPIVKNSGQPIKNPFGKPKTQQKPNPANNLPVVPDLF